MSTPYCIVVCILLNVRVAGVIRSTRARYAGYLGIPIPNWPIYLTLILSKFDSFYNG